MARLLALAGALLVLAAVLPTCSHAATPKQFFGMMADGPLLLDPGVDLDAQAAQMAASGVAWVRLAVYWDDTEPTKGGPYVFGATDRVVLAMARHGIRVMPVVWRAPADQRINQFDPASPPIDPAAFGAFLGVLVKRYGPAGTLWSENPSVPKTPVYRWQMWNEPDIGKFFTPGYADKTWAVPYAKLAAAGNAAIHAADPGAISVCAGLSARVIADDIGWLYEAGIRSSCQVMAVHAYGNTVAGTMRVVRSARRRMDERGDSHKALLVSEVTASSGRGEVANAFGWETDETGQAVIIRQVLTRLARQRRNLGLLGVSWYTWMSPAPGSKWTFDYSGLLRLSLLGTPEAKPALAAFRDTVATLTAKAPR